MIVALAGRGVSLTVPAEHELTYLHGWEADLTSLHLWTSNRFVQTEAEFKESIQARLRGSIHTAFFIRRRENADPTGIIYSYDLSAADGFAFVTTYVEPKHRGTGLAIRAAYLFFDYLFSYHPLRKVYCDVYGYNTLSLATMLKAGFQIEGQLKDHRFYAGGYHDLYRLALYREVFQVSSTKHLEYLRGRVSGSLLTAKDSYEIMS